jgi:hypothetical protein
LIVRKSVFLAHLSDFGGCLAAFSSATNNRNAKRLTPLEFRSFLSSIPKFQLDWVVNHRENAIFLDPSCPKI